VAVFRQLMVEWTEFDQPLNTLTHPLLRRALEYANPKTLFGMVSGNTVKADVTKNYERGQKTRAEYLKVFISRSVIVFRN
jgi:hypothetical protein